MKNILKSKTFWFNLLAMAADYAGVNPLPTSYAVPVLGAANLVLRYVTHQPISLLPVKD
jgi:hypothetical protein